MADKKKDEATEQQETEYTGMPNEEFPDMESDRGKDKAKEQSEDNLGDGKEKTSE